MLERLPYKEVLRYVMNLERHNARTLADYMGVGQNSVNSTLGDRCGMTMENFLRYCEALNITLYAEWEDPTGRRPKVKFCVE